MRITFSCKTDQLVFTLWRRYKKGHLFHRTSPIADSRHSVLFSFRIGKGRRAFEEDENGILQRNIEENSDNIVQNQEQE